MEFVYFPIIAIECATLVTVPHCTCLKMSRALVAILLGGLAT